MNKINFLLFLIILFFLTSCYKRQERKKLEGEWILTQYFTLSLNNTKADTLNISLFFTKKSMSLLNKEKCSLGMKYYLEKINKINFDFNSMSENINECNGQEYLYLKNKIFYSKRYELTESELLLYNDNTSEYYLFVPK